MEDWDAMTEGELKEAQRNEAASRLYTLELMGLHPRVRAEFEADGRTGYSERAAFRSVTVGILYWMDNETAKSRSGERFSEVVRAFEDETGGLVYHATHEHLEFGELLDLFYVSAEPGEWMADHVAMAEERRAFVRAVNLDDDSSSDFGDIGFTVSGGGLVRIW